MEYSTEILNRLKRIEGQVRGVIRLMDEGKDCKDVVTQLTAIRSAVDKTIATVVGSKMEQCIREQMEKGESTESVIKEAIELLVKSR